MQRKAIMGTSGTSAADERHEPLAKRNTRSQSLHSLLSSFLVNLLVISTPMNMRIHRLATTLRLFFGVNRPVSQSIDERVTEHCFLLVRWIRSTSVCIVLIVEVLIRTVWRGFGRSDTSAKPHWGRAVGLSLSPSHKRQSLSSIHFFLSHALCITQTIRIGALSLG